MGVVGYVGRLQRTESLGGWCEKNIGNREDGNGEGCWISWAVIGNWSDIINDGFNVVACIDQRLLDLISRTGRKTSDL